MQLRCTFCQTMFGIGREETLAALEYMDENNLKYYDAHCPKCRRANRVERIKLEFSYPGWREAIQEMAKRAPTAGMVANTPATPAALAATPQKKKKTHTRAADRLAARPAVSSPKGKKTVLKSPPKGKKPVAKTVTKKTTASVSLKGTKSQKGKPSSKGGKPAVKPFPKAKPKASVSKGKPSSTGKKPVVKPSLKGKTAQSSSKGKKPAGTRTR